MTTDEIMKLIDKICIESCKLGQIEFDTDMALDWLKEERSEIRSAIDALVKENEELKQLNKDVFAAKLRYQIRLGEVMAENESLKTENDELKRNLLAIKILSTPMGTGTGGISSVQNIGIVSSCSMKQNSQEKTRENSL